MAVLGDQLRDVSARQAHREHAAAVDAAIRHEVEGILGDIQRLQEKGFALAAVSLEYRDQPINMLTVCDLLDSLRGEFQRPMRPAPDAG